MTDKAILWPTDMTVPASHALPTVRERILRQEATIHLAYVSEDLTAFERYWGSGPDSKHTESLRRFAERQAKQRLQDICDCELKGCEDYEIHFAYGNVADEIVRLVKELNIDEVVVAKPSKGEPTSFAAGVEEAIRRLSIPVTTIDVPPDSGPTSCEDPSS